LQGSLLVGAAMCGLDRRRRTHLGRAFVADCRVVLPKSPYNRIPKGRWLARTEELLEDYPVQRSELVEVVLGAWEDILKSRIGGRLEIGKHLFPTPQNMAGYLHELIPYDLQERYPKKWRRDASGADKDLVYIPDEYWSTEIKTSSHPSQVFGNRSYAQLGTGKKSKSGFYLTVNFEKWSEAAPGLPRIRLIRLGWLDHTDWIAQVASSGQQARIRPEAYAGKLVELFSA